MKSSKEHDRAANISLNSEGILDMATQPDVMQEIADLASFMHCCCDSSPIESNALPLLHTPIRPSQSSPPCCFSLLNQSLFVVSESTWLTVKHMMTQPGGNEHSLLLSACLTQMDCWNEDYILWVKSERGQTDVIFVGLNLIHILSLLVP